MAEQKKQDSQPTTGEKKALETPEEVRAAAVREAENKLRENQIIVPAGALPGGKSSIPQQFVLPRFDSAQVSEIDERLESAGWEMTGTTDRGERVWRDPQGAAGSGKGEVHHVRMLPANTQEREPVAYSKELKQLVLNPPKGEYTTLAALEIQYARDAIGGFASPLARLDALAKKLDEFTDKISRIAADLEHLTRRPTPDRLDNLRAELTLTRRQIAKAVSDLKPQAA